MNRHMKYLECLCVCAQVIKMSHSGVTTSCSSKKKKKISITSSLSPRAGRWGCYKSSPGSLWPWWPAPWCGYSWRSMSSGQSLPCFTWKDTQWALASPQYNTSCQFYAATNAHPFILLTHSWTKKLRFCRTESQQSALLKRTLLLC